MGNQRQAMCQSVTMELQPSDSWFEDDIDGDVDVLSFNFIAKRLVERIPA